MPDIEGFTTIKMQWNVVEMLAIRKDLGGWPCEWW